MLADNSLISVIFIHVPYHKRIGYLPGRGAYTGIFVVGYHIRHASIFVLSIFYILEPFGVKSCHIKVEYRLFNCKMGISQPSLTLVSMWRIGRYAMQIAQLTPDNILMNLIKQGIGRVKFTMAGHIRMDYSSLQTRQIRFPGESLYLDIAKSMVGEAGLVYFTLIIPS